MSSDDFYASLPAVTEFRGLTMPGCYAPVPPDWTVAVTDVAGSTHAIAEGRYREVNRAGGIAVVALGNLFGDRELPFVFGGDGVVFLLPPGAVDAARDALADTRKLSKDAFGLVLRVGFVPVADLVQAGCTIGVAKFMVSGKYTQAMFSGDGLGAAEDLVKQPGSPWLLPDDHPLRGTTDFSGFSCRWRDIPSGQGETVSLIVRPRGDALAVMDRVLQEIARAAGGDDAYHPLSVAAMVPAGGHAASVEARVVAGGGWRSALKQLAIRLELKMGWYLMRTGTRGKAQVNGYDIVELRERILASCDYRKFDGSLKMVLSLKTGARRKIEAWLDRAEQAGELAYGLHVSDRAVLTCTIHERSGREVHFVDAADGGYALAARRLKEANAQERAAPAPSVA